MLAGVLGNRSVLLPGGVEVISGISQNRGWVASSSPARTFVAASEVCGAPGPAHDSQKTEAALDTSK